MGGEAGLFEGGGGMSLAHRLYSGAALDLRCLCSGTLTCTPFYPPLQPCGGCFGKGARRRHLQLTDNGLRLHRRRRQVRHRCQPQGCEQEGWGRVEGRARVSRESDTLAATGSNWQQLAATGSNWCPVPTLHPCLLLLPCLLIQGGDSNWDLCCFSAVAPDLYTAFYWGGGALKGKTSIKTNLAVPAGTSPSVVQGTSYVWRGDAAAGAVATEKALDLDTVDWVEIQVGDSGRRWWGAPRAAASGDEGWRADFSDGEQLRKGQVGRWGGVGV